VESEPTTVPQRPGGEEVSSLFPQESAEGAEFLEGTLDCVFLLDAEWRFTYLNQRAQSEIASGRNLLGRSIWREFPQSQNSIFEDRYLRAMHQREHVSFETYFAPLSAWYEVQAGPLSSGGIGVWFRNINARKLASDALAAVEERYRLVASAATDMVLEWDMATDEVTWSAALASELGHRDEVKSLSWCTDRVHPDDRQRFEAEIARAIIDGSRLFCEARFLRQYGRYADFEFRGVFQRTPAGRATRLICAMQDVTERNLANDALARREGRLANIFGQALVGIMECGRDGRATLVNARYCEILGRTADEIRQCQLADYTHPDDLAWNHQVLFANKDDGTPFQVEKRYIRPDGTIVFCRVSVSFVLDAANQIECSVIVAEDISDMKRAEAELRASELLYRSVLEASADCIEIISPDQRLELMNTPGLAVRGIENFDEIRGSAWSSLWPADSRPLVEAAFAEAAVGRTARFSAQCPTGSGMPRWCDVMVSPMFDDHGRVSKILSISRDITAQRDVDAQIKWASEHDALTGLANRSAFEAHLQGAIARATLADTQVGLLLIDLDHFKHVNDTLGHAAGDRFLAEFGLRLQQSLGPAGLVARLGGDEFALVLEGGATPLNMLVAGDSILERLQQPIVIDGRVMAAGASIGGAVFPRDGDSANELFNNADTALYALKESGRGGTRMFHQHMRQHAQVISSQLSLARNAIAARSIEPHYQQKIDLRSGGIAGFEALLRWRHVRCGIQYPATLAESFKDYDLASKIGELMQCQVFGDVRHWLDVGLPIGYVAINAAPVEFLRDDFAERMLARMDHYGLPPDLIELEITEHVFLARGSDYVTRALKVLSRAGVRIALDDFGTGYSSLSHLRDFPVDVVKIDRSFIERITIDHEVRAIVSAVVDLAKSLHIEVVAEGIETAEQQDLLVGYGCTMGQGFLFGEPIPASEVATLFGRGDAAAPPPPSHLG